MTQSDSEIFFADDGVTIYCGDCRSVLKTLPDASVNCCVTSPPYYGLRNYGVDGQIGLEPTPAQYVAEMVAVFGEVRRVLRDDGTLWLNLGDSYASNWPCNRRNVVGAGSLPNGKREARPPRMGAGLKDKDLIGVPWMVAFALRADGWYLRSDIIWHKPNPMPESVTDRPTKAHEYLFLLTKSERYHYDAEAIKEAAATAGESMTFTTPYKQSRQMGNRGSGNEVNGAVLVQDELRNKRSVWSISSQPFKEAHFATFPPKLIEPCILAGCPDGGVVLDPFFGAGTTGVVCREQHVRCIGIELNREYCGIAKNRLSQPGLPLFTGGAA